MPKVTEAHRTARRDEILNAAQQVFARSGYRGSSMAQIIKESGLSAGAIYSYFASKEELFHAVVERTFTLRTATITEPRTSTPRSPGVLIRSVIADMLGQPILTIAPQVWAEAAVEPEAKAAMATVFERLGELLRTELVAWAAAHPERVDGDPLAWATRLVPVLISTIPGFIVQRMAMSGFDEVAYLDALTETFDR